MDKRDEQIAQMHMEYQRRSMNLEQALRSTQEHAANLGARVDMLELHCAQLEHVAYNAMDELERNNAVDFLLITDGVVRDYWEAEKKRDKK